MSSVGYNHDGCVSTLCSGFIFLLFGEIVLLGSRSVSFSFLLRLALRCCSTAKAFTEFASANCDLLRTVPLMGGRVLLHLAWASKNLLEVE